MKAHEAFRHDPAVQVLVATDAAGEGINLQRVHLMVNYDLPWNPNRIEQRFGRIHRIGQTEVCHLWNLVAEETREGDVYRKLLDKLEQAREALGAQVFDVLGKFQFEGKPTDRETEKLGYDIESAVPGTGKLRFIEVKGRVTGAPTITVTRNEILYSLNKPEDFNLAIVEFLDGDSHRVHYIRQPFQREPDFGVTSVNYDFAELLSRAEVMNSEKVP